MPRSQNQARTRRARVEQTPDVGRLSVVHPGPEQVTAPSSAGQTANDLAAAFGIAGGIADVHDQEEAERAKLAVARGDVSLDNLNDLDEGSRFVYHSNRLLREADARATASDILERYQTEFDKTADDDQLTEWLQAQFDENFAGLDDEDLAHILPIFEKAESAVVDAHQAQQVENVLAGVEEAGASKARTALVSDEFDSKALRDDLAQNFGVAGANEIVARAVVDVINETGDPTIADKVPHLASNPKYRDSIAQARESAQRQAAAVDTTVRLAEFKNLAATGQAHVGDNPERIFQGVRDGIITPDGAAGLISRSALSELRDIEEEDFSLLALNGYANQIPSKADQQTAIDQAAVIRAERTGEDVEEARFALAVQNGIMPASHKNQMQQVSLANEENWQRGFQTFMQYKAAEPKMAAANVSEKRQRQYNVYEYLTNTAGLDHKSASEAIRTGDLDAAAAELGRGLNRELLEDAIEDIRDISWSWREIQNTPVLRNNVRNAALAYLAPGHVTAEDAVKMAVSDLKDNRVEIDGYNFHYSQGWPAEDTDDFVEWAKTRMIPEGEDPADFKVVPNFSTQSTKSVVLLRNGDLPWGSGHIELNIEEQANLWRGAVRGQQIEEVLEERAEREKASFRRAARSLRRQGVGSPSTEDIEEFIRQQSESREQVKEGVIDAAAAPFRAATALPRWVWDNLPEDLFKADQTSTSGQSGRRRR